MSKHTEAVIVLYRDGPVRYRFEDDGVNYTVERTTDGTLSSAINWAVFSITEDGHRHHEGDFYTLADIRSYPWSNSDRKTRMTESKNEAAARHIDDYLYYLAGKSRAPLNDDQIAAKVEHPIREVVLTVADLKAALDALSHILDNGTSTDV